jgi:hypothetical protein
MRRCTVASVEVGELPQIDGKGPGYKVGQAIGDGARIAHSRLAEDN